VRVRVKSVSCESIVNVQFGSSVLIIYFFNLFFKSVLKFVLVIVCVGYDV